PAQNVALKGATKYLNCGMPPPRKSLMEVRGMARPGLRLSKAVMDELGQAYQVARGRKDLDMAERIQGLLLVSEGVGERRAAQIVGVGRRTLQDWISRYRRGGLEALVKGPYLGRKPKLTHEQLLELDRIIEQGPESAGLDTGVWTAPLAADLVKKLFGVRYHPDHMRRILRRLRFSVQLPTRELSRADPEEQTLWLDHELQAIKKS
ncbi:MAG: IS630 family transposase, partial [Candidatus Micrarchaeota archaeon]